MSAWSQRRRLSIILTLVVLGVFVLSGLLFVIFYRPPNCNDGIQNGSETGIDCGGVCERLCAIRPKQLRAIWTRPFPIANGVYAAVAYIENQNENLYVPEVQIEIDLYNEAGEYINRSSFFTPIMPGSITPVFVPHIITGVRKATTASFRFTEEPVFAEQPYPYGFTFKDIHTETAEGISPYVRALAVNVGAMSVAEVDFVVILFDEEGNAVAASRTFEENMEPEEERVIQFTWVHPITLRKGTCPGGLCIKQIKRVEIIPIVRQW